MSQASKPFGGQNMVDPLRRVLVRRPNQAFAAADPERWHYAGPPDLAAAQSEHDALVEVLREAGAEVVYHQASLPDHADAIYVFDPVIVTDHGAVVLRMGKSLRQGEERALEESLTAAGVPTLFSLEGEGLAEGGDLLWLDAQTLVAGRGFRTNASGIAQLRSGLAEYGIDVLSVDLPYFTGPAACFHLMSMISPVDHDLAVVYRPLLPVPLWELLTARGMRLIDVPEKEFLTMGTNVLTLAPRRCLMVEGNPVTEQQLIAAGCKVATYRGREISLRAEGGPTCLTRPILREKSTH